MTCWKCKKTSHMKKDCRFRKGNDGAGSNGSKDPEKQQGYNSDFIQNFNNVLHYVSVISDAFYVQDDEVACWVNSGATSLVCKDLRRISTIRLFLPLATIHDLVIHQMDVKTAFLNGDLDEEIYMKQPEGFVILGHESKIESIDG
ncbi:zinc finger, CCHC-type containing protein [Tanacetum coccineum]